jgi:hypothetical protein
MIWLPGGNWRRPLLEGIDRRPGDMGFELYIL